MGNVALFILPRELSRRDLRSVREGKAPRELVKKVQAGPSLYLGQFVERGKTLEAGGPTRAAINLLGPDPHVLTPELIDALSLTFERHNFTSLEINLNYRGAWEWLRKHEGRVVFTGGIN